MIERLRGSGRAGGVGMAVIVLLAACAGGRAGTDAGTGALDEADEIAAEQMPPGDDGPDGSEELGDPTPDELEEPTQAELEEPTPDVFGEPTPEETSEEAPAEVEIDATTIQVATLPIGGSPDVAGGTLQCVDVGWSDPPEIPPGVTVVIQGLVLAPAGHFELSGQACPGDAPPCLPDHAVTPERRCTVAVGWTEAAGDDGGSLRASGTMVCDVPADVCSAFADAVAERGGDSIDLLPPPDATTPSGNDAGEEGNARGGAEDTPENARGDAEGDGGDGAGDGGAGLPENGEG